MERVTGSDNLFAQSRTLLHHTLESQREDVYEDLADSKVGVGERFERLTEAVELVLVGDS